MNSEAIREIQNALRTIANSDTRIPLVSIDGFYTPQTAQAVTTFQRIEQLPITGEVDPDTFDRLMQNAAAVTAVPALPIAVFPHPSYVIRPQEENEIVPFVKAMINALSDSYATFPRITEDTLYDTKTVEVIRELQRLHGLSDDAIIDRDTWNVLVNTFITRPSLRSERT